MKTFGTSFTTPENVTFRPYLYEKHDGDKLIGTEIGYEVTHAEGHPLWDDTEENPGKVGFITLAPSTEADGEPDGHGNVFVYYNHGDTDEHFSWVFDVPDGEPQPEIYTVVGVWLDGEAVAAGTVLGQHDVDGGNGETFEGHWAQHVVATSIAEAEAKAVQLCLNELAEDGVDDDEGEGAQ